MDTTTLRSHVGHSLKHGAARIVRQCTQLPPEGALDRAALAAKEDPRAREQVVIWTAPLVHQLAQRLYNQWGGKLPASALYCDIFQAGQLGILDAIRKYDPDKGAFTTIAVPWIRQKIQREGIARALSSTRINYETALKLVSEGDERMLATSVDSLDRSCKADDDTETVGSMFAACEDDIELRCNREILVDALGERASVLGELGEGNGKLMRRYGMKVGQLNRLRDLVRDGCEV